MYVRRQAEPGAKLGFHGVHPRGAWLRLVVVVVFASAALASLVVTTQRLEPPARGPFDARPLREIRRVQPDFVLIGNSMVNTRFHEKTLRQLLAPRTVVKVANGGSKSSAWYLYLKNYVIASGVRPRRVILFFVDNDLTRPGSRRGCCSRAG
ncbi:MAG TPA: hypothetical protein VER33_19065 [Polyangiaceae bacterium]|nr:hypothetical protein [Polyangiaceae bacterium]